MKTQKVLGEEEFIFKHKRINNGEKPSTIQLFAWRVGFNYGWNVGFSDSKHETLKKVCQQCPTNGGEQCEESYGCWIRSRILDDGKNLYGV